MRRGTMAGAVTARGLMLSPVRRIAGERSHGHFSQALPGGTL